MARGLLCRKTPETAGLWLRAAALLARQALESALVRRLHPLHPALASCPARIQLLCLSELVGAREEAAQVAHVWQGLSRTCHHHAYETTPLAAELEAWLLTVERVSCMVGGASPGDQR